MIRTNVLNIYLDRSINFGTTITNAILTLQNFLAFLQLEKCPTITHCYIVEVEIALEVSNKTKRNRKSV